MKDAELNASTRMFDSKPSITLCITELDVGGAEKAFVRIAIGLKNQGWSVRVISLRDAGVMAEDLNSAGIDVVALRGHSLADVRIFWRLWSQLKRFPTDVLLTFLYQANFYGRLAGRAAGIPTIVSGIRVADRRWIVTASDQMTKCWTKHYVAVSRHVADVHAKLCRIDADRITAIYNGVDAQPAPLPQAASAKKPVGRHVILFVGRLTTQKNPLLLLNAFRGLRPELQESAEVCLAGEGPLRPQLEQRIHRWQLSDRVRLLGQVSDVPALMRDATILAVPSNWEGLPNVILEAMAVGLPVVATAIDGVPEVLEDGVTGWLTPNGDAKAFSLAISEALTQPDARRSRSDAAQVVVTERFSWDTAISEYDQLLRRLRQI
ncbi:glycosyltransferase [Fuerstiella marisgermanici]|uniref:GalNAc-alpha-(1->4)-GalNAc-alpha-(1->3)-diNAcBac-PP-undecaprenol alpha-1,4-N-acetyl-D-galactosaminyltransferase n=1 Tax=Fuerstiella marisgermanici TaxID=1891926 RepID=A0A1P8WA30_9PLAN|nr:glycosyltransferase [Fuerstiella marisgermanici]APZ90917.1 GalNAc-alpha-(1->4)-GalNAc-alpha-(1->3)-diNAcBac-PP-undecaprenol alpha-1,4-N-acetyl-D-galactosaminyltransferase [Fuerstiella marisgermanici]